MLQVLYRVVQGLVHGLVVNRSSTRCGTGFGAKAKGNQRGLKEIKGVTLGSLKDQNGWN